MPKKASIFRSNFYPLLLLLLVVSFLHSCKTKKKFIDLNQGTVQNVTIDSIYRLLTNPSIPTWLNAKAKAKISDPYGSDQGKLYLRIKKDSIVWSAVKKVSIEGGRAQVNQDSVYFVNRLNKTWSGLSMYDVQNKYGINPKLDYIQNILIGIAPSVNKTNILDQKEDSTHYHIRTNIDGIVHDMSFKKSNGFLTHGRFKSQYGVDGHWTYDDYRVCNNGQFLPFNRSYHLTLGAEDYLDLKLDFSSIELEIPQTITFEILGHYTKI